MPQQSIAAGRFAIAAAQAGNAIAAVANAAPFDALLPAAIAIVSLAYPAAAPRSAL